MSTLDHASRLWLAWMIAATWQLALLVCIVALVGNIARATSPRLRYCLWLLVLAKVFLPPTLTTPISIGRWGVAPLLETARQASIGSELPSAFDRLDDSAVAERDEPTRQLSAVERLPSVPVLLMITWGIGGLLFWILVACRYATISRIGRSARPIDEGPVRVSFEQIAMDLKLRRVPDLLATETVTSPFLFGVTQPRIILPDALLRQLGDIELKAVLTHELVHWKRHDTWIGWLQVLGQSIYWFHPAVWWANRQLRHERECVCDEMVLSLGRISPRHYGESILRVLTESRARSLVAGSLVGVFEPGAKLQNRLEDIMNYEPIKRQFNWASRLALTVFAALFLPMAPGILETSLVAAGQDGIRTKPKTDADSVKTPYPQIVETIPKQGAIGVDPALTEITLVFDRDMSQGMSWTGGPPLFPPTDESRQARWTDTRTCVLPVNLKKAAYYRVGINSTSHQNFRDASGIPTPCSVIGFATTGASDAVERRVRAPKIVKISPENGALDVDPETALLRVTFDMPMGDGMSWTGGGPRFPKDSPDGKKPSWSKDGRKCTLPVLLEPGHEYELGLNSLKHINFQSKWGMPLEPIVYKFRTRDAKE
jgi:beta-lactamase regulating signal transducer with metallopeptidase domain